MRIKVTLEAPGSVRVPANHQDALAAIVYGFLERSNPGYSQFLHDEGYSAPGDRRNVKLFCFGWLRARGCRVEGDQLRFRPGPVEWMLSSPVDDFLHHGAAGLLTGGSLIRICSAYFRVACVEALQPPDFSSGLLHCTCLSPIVASVHRPAGESRHARYIRPTETEEFSQAIHSNLAYKYRVLHDEDPSGESAQVEFNQDYLRSHRGGTKMITTNGIQVIGAYAPFTLRASPALLRTAYDCGLGEKNSAGFGMVEMRVGG